MPNRPAFSEQPDQNRKAQTNNLLDLLYEQASADSFIAENLYGGFGLDPGAAQADFAKRYSSLKYFDID